MQGESETERPGWRTEARCWFGEKLEVRGCGELISRIEEVITETETNTENEMIYRGGEQRPDVGAVRNERMWGANIQKRREANNQNRRGETEMRPG